MDTVIDTDDILPFVEALMNPSEYYQQRADNEVGSADMNLDGVVDGRDVQGFVAALLGQ